MPDPAGPLNYGVPNPGGQVDWKPWPTNQQVPTDAFTDKGVLITAYAKFRPCLVITLADDMDVFGHALVLPLSSFKPSTPLQTLMIRGNQVSHTHFLTGDSSRGIEDATVDFRWSSRVRAEDLRRGRHEAELDPRLLVALLLRYRNYLYYAPGNP